MNLFSSDETEWEGLLDPESEQLLVDAIRNSYLTGAERRKLREDLNSDSSLFSQKERNMFLAAIAE